MSCKPVKVVPANGGLGGKLPPVVYAITGFPLKN
jgi:hypothetical protein